MKKRLSSHHDTLNKLKHTQFHPQSIEKNIEMTASKRTMYSQAFKTVSERNKARQLVHIEENKQDIIAVQELDHYTLAG